MTIDNLQFIPEYASPNSSEFIELAAILEEKLKTALLTEEMLKNADVEVKIVKMM